MNTKEVPRDGRSNRFRIAAWGLGAMLLVIPAVAMQFTSEVNWTAGDFIFATVLIFGTLGLFELGVRATRNIYDRLALGVALLGFFLMIWINLAVGTIGSEDNLLNQPFFALPVIAAIGAAMTRLPDGMAIVMLIVAVTTVCIGVYAFIQGYVAIGPVIVLCSFWLASAWLFRRSLRA